jgi:hypothetical protein
MLRRVRKTDRCPEHDTQRGFIARYARHTRAGKRRDGRRRACWRRWSARWRARADGCFRFAEDGEATLRRGGRSFPRRPLRDALDRRVRARAAARSRSGGGRLLLSVLHGAHRRSDIGTLQATAAPGTLFQVASQFNCLEAPGPHIVPVRDYVHRKRRDPRVVLRLSRDLLRHYRAPARDGTGSSRRTAGASTARTTCSRRRVGGGSCGVLRASQDPRDGRAGFGARRALRSGCASACTPASRSCSDTTGVAPVPRSPAGHRAGVHLHDRARRVRHDDGDPASRRRAAGCARAYLGTLLAAGRARVRPGRPHDIGGGVFANPHGTSGMRSPLGASPRSSRSPAARSRSSSTTREPVADEDRAQVRARGGTFVELDA